MDIADVNNDNEIDYLEFKRLLDIKKFGLRNGGNLFVRNAINFGLLDKNSILADGEASVFIGNKGFDPLNCSTDIITLKKYKNFDLSFDWKLGKLGNSGVKYFVEELPQKPANSSSLIGYEYQLIDDPDFIYNDKHLPEDHKTGALYNMVPPNKPDVKIGQWHTSRIVVKGEQIEHWLDNKLIISVNRNSNEFKNGFLQSKFKSITGYDSRKEGYILLQDHGHNVAFKNIKIKELD